jgi:hypothetical protein
MPLPFGRNPAFGRETPLSAGTIPALCRKAVKSPVKTEVRRNTAADDFIPQNNADFDNRFMFKPLCAINSEYPGRNGNGGIRAPAKKHYVKRLCRHNIKLILRRN